MNKMLRDEPRGAADGLPDRVPEAKPLWAMSRREAEAALRARAGLPPIRRTWPWIVLAAVLLAAAAGGAYLWANRPATAVEGPVLEETAEVVRQLIPAEYSVLRRTTLERVTKATGNLRPSHRAALSAEVGGRVEEVSVRPGDTVREGDVLVRVDVTTLSSDLDLARLNASATRAQLELAETQLERSTSLRERGVTSSAALDEVRSQVQSLRTNLDAQVEQVRAAEARLEKATVRAPFDGIVSSREVDAGQYVGVASALLTLVDMSLMEMEAAAPAAAVSRVTPGDPVQVEVDGLPGRAFAGVVDRINPVATQGTRTVPVYIHIENSDATLSGGMFASGRIITDRAEDALAVPAQALREDADGRYVLRVTDGRVERAGVEVSGTWGGLVRVRAGLAEGEVVVTAPLASLAPGDAVELIGS